MGEKKIEDVLKKMNSMDKSMAKRLLIETPPYQNSGIEQPIKRHDMVLKTHLKSATKSPYLEEMKDQHRVHPI